MTDIVERLHVVRDHLRTGRFGQREVWEEWLTEAADEIERLRAALGTISQSGSQNLGEDMLRAIARRALEPKP